MAHDRPEHERHGQVVFRHGRLRDRLSETYEPRVGRGPPLTVVQNILNVGSMVGSAIQQSTTGSTQHIAAPLDVDSLRDIVEAIGEQLAHIQLEANDRAEVEAEVSTLKAQLDSPKPKRAILTASLQSLRRITETAVASGASPEIHGLLEQATHLAGSAF
jgi:hypothetical protein